MTATAQSTLAHDPSAAPAKRSERFSGVEGLRAIAALAVLISHVGTYSNSRGSDLVGRLINGTEIGVTLFFLISGFLLYRPFLLAYAEGSRVSLRGYARRRFFRIGPPYWTILTGLALWPGLAGGVLGDHAAKYYGFAQIYGQYDEAGGISPAWSLCTEVTFYAILPLLAWGLHRCRRAVNGPAGEIAVLAVLALASAVVHSYLVGHPVGDWAGLSRSLPANFDWFALGMIVAVISTSPGFVATFAQQTVGRARYAVPAAALVYLLMTAQREPMHLAQGLACFLVLAPLVLGASDNALNRVLSMRVFTILGLISYSIFLLHDPLAHWLGDHATTNFVALLALTLAVTIPLAATSYRLVELPSMILGRAGRAKREASHG